MHDWPLLGQAYPASKSIYFLSNGRFLQVTFIIHTKQLKRTQLII